MARRGGTAWGRHPSSRLLVALAALLATAACGGSDDGVALVDGPIEFYGLRALPAFHISLSPAARASLGRAPREWVEADLRYGAMRWTVGLRLKGHRSLRKLDAKPSFKIKMDRFEPKARFFGGKGLVLNNLIEDPTMVREILAYRLHRQLGVPAPDVGYARVYLDGRYAGLYLYVEPIDKRFLRAHFEDDEGELYEGEYGCDLHPEDVAVLQQEAGSDDRAALAALSRTAAGPVGELIGQPTSRFDPSALTYLAVSALIGDFDGYRHAHNYRLYREPTLDRWYFIPWGLDRALKKSLDVYDSAGLVARRCFADRACRIAYLRELVRAADQLERFGFDRGIEVLYAFIREAAAEDVLQPTSPREIRAARDELVEFLRRRPGEVRAALTCLDEDGRELDRDGDGHGCLDCDDDDPAIHPGAAEACDGVDNDCSRRVDDAAACPCPEIEVEGARLAMCDLAMGWDDAAAMCAAKGGALARLDTLAATEAVQRAAHRIREDRWWIGLRERPTGFAWSDGAPLGFDAWSRGEPDDGGCNQHCVALREDGDGRWEDLHCAQPAPFVCQLGDTLPPARSARTNGSGE